MDKSLKLGDRLKLARLLWDIDAKNVLSSNKQQLVLDWTVDLIVSNKRKWALFFAVTDTPFFFTNLADFVIFTQKRKYLFDENDLIQIWDQLYYYLTDIRYKNNPIGNGIIFVQVVFCILRIDHKLVKFCIQLFVVVALIESNRYAGHFQCSS